MFQFVFLADRTAEEQEEIVLFFVDMIARSMEPFETAAGVDGISAQRVVQAIKEGLDPPE
jgi:hypothetical protein